MRVVPAIDLRGGKCVRLARGDYSRETVYGDDPAGVAAGLADQGASLLHVVDLDGARDGRPRNLAWLAAILRRVEIPVEFGGGLRDDRSVARILDLGVSRVVLGSAALARPTWAAALSRTYPGQVVVGLDARAGRLAVRGWRKQTSAGLLETARRFIDLGVRDFVYTDIDRDGMEAGPDLEGTATLKALGGRVFTAGGVAGLKDLEKLAGAGADGAIIGRAFLSGRMSVKEAIGHVLGTSRRVS